MVSRTQIVKSQDFNPSCLAIKTASNSIEVRYNERPFYLNTGILECPHGVDHTEGLSYGTVLLDVADESVMSTVIDSLDKIALKVGAKKSQTLFGETLAENDVPYWSLVSDHVLKLLLNYKDGMPSQVSVFGSDGSRLTCATELNSRFTASFLLQIQGLIIGRDGKLRWDISVKQIKIDEASRLPPGCLIVDTDEEVQEELNSRNRTQVRGQVQELLIDTNLDPERNELLD